jgi:3-oxoacyl-[acyl-carrier protein] reductase
MPQEIIYPPKGPCYADLKNKIALVTGGGTGIGRGICIRFAQEGMRVFFCGRREDKLRETTEMIQAFGGHAVPIVADVSKEEDVNRLYSTLRDQAQTLDVLVHNAAILGGKPFMQTDTAMWREYFSTNTDSAFFLTKRAGEMMIPRQSGSIIFLSTIGATRAHNGTPVYDSTKGAIDSLTRALAIELAPTGIRVNAIAPGPVPGRDADIHVKDPQRATDLAFKDEIPLDRFRQKYVPLGRYGTPAEIASVAAFFASTQSSFITGQVLAVDGGVTIQLAPPGIYI